MDASTKVAGSALTTLQGVGACPTAVSFASRHPTAAHVSTTSLVVAAVAATGPATTTGCTRVVVVAPVHRFLVCCVHCGMQCDMCTVG